MDKKIEQTLLSVARYYDQKKVGDTGPLGFRRSTDMTTLLACLDRLLDLNYIIPGKSCFLDMGCADGRVNMMLGYLVRASIGIELDDWTMEEYGPLRSGLEKMLHQEALPLPPENIALFQGDSTDEAVYQTVWRKTGVSFNEFDLFYTYLVMHEEFAQLIKKNAKTGALFLVYGLRQILPEYEGFQLLEDLSPMEDILGVYQKI